MFYYSFLLTQQKLRQTRWINPEGGAAVGGRVGERFFPSPSSCGFLSDYPQPPGIVLLFLPVFFLLFVLSPPHSLPPLHLHAWVCLEKTRDCCSLSSAERKENSIKQFFPLNRTRRALHIAARHAAAAACSMQQPHAAAAACSSSMQQQHAAAAAAAAAAGGDEALLAAVSRSPRQRAGRWQATPPQYHLFMQQQQQQQQPASRSAALHGLPLQLLLQQQPLPQLLQALRRRKAEKNRLGDGRLVLHAISSLGLPASVAAAAVGPLDRLRILKQTGSPLQQQQQQQQRLLQGAARRKATAWEVWGASRRRPRESRRGFVAGRELRCSTGCLPPFGVDEDAADCGSARSSRNPQISAAAAAAGEVEVFASLLLQQARITRPGRVVPRPVLGLGLSASVCCYLLAFACALPFRVGLAGETHAAKPQNRRAGPARGRRGSACICCCGRCCGKPQRQQQQLHQPQQQQRACMQPPAAASHRRLPDGSLSDSSRSSSPHLSSRHSQASSSSSSSSSGKSSRREIARAVAAVECMELRKRRAAPSCALACACRRRIQAAAFCQSAAAAAAAAAATPAAAAAAGGDSCRSSTQQHLLPEETQGLRARMHAFKQRMQRHLTRVVYGEPAAATAAPASAAAAACMRRQEALPGPLQLLRSHGLHACKHPLLRGCWAGLPLLLFKSVPEGLVLLLTAKLLSSA
ncbi:hypothetical protein Efla_001593 [Eimeria flavescens]